MITLTEEQQKIHDDIIDWFFNSNQPYITLGGLAGTGKTTLIGFITDTLKEKHNEFPIAYVTYTGKASVVLKNKIQNLDFNDFTGTIHSLIYKPITDETGQIIDWALKENIDCSLIVLDEASMVGKEIWKDLLSYNIPILAVGDYGQLPPIGSDNFSLMSKPDLKLKTIHRQALENPIIKLSLFVRRNGYIPTKIFGQGVGKFDYYLSQVPKKYLDNYNFRTDSQILCGMNKTRVKLNNLIRNIHKYDDRNEPHKDEKLICLKNNKKLNIMNGQMGYLVSATIKTDFLIDLIVNMDNNDWNVIALSHRKAFGQVNYDICSKELYNKKILNGLNYEGKPAPLNMFDFGYAISVHKSQGSEYKRVILIEERNSYQSDEEYARWLYTAITRASEKLIIIDNFF